jgi:enolase
MSITTLHAQEILDSRGNPTIEVTCTLSSGAVGIASVPSGASTGIHEAVEKRDGDPHRYGGLGVQNAIESITKDMSILLGSDITDQKTLDEKLISLDGTPNKSRLGANAILAVSLAFARARTNEDNVPLYKYIASLSGTTSFNLPTAMFNIINGGKHADSGLDIQEFMVVPTGFDTLRKKVEAASEITHTLGKILEEKGYASSIGDEGGFAPQLHSNEEALEHIVDAIEKAGYVKQDVQLAIDAAASSFYHNGSYHVSGTSMTSDELITWYVDLTARFPLISIEDGLAEDDWTGFTMLNEKLGGAISIVGDDLTVTNVARIKEAAEKKAINTVLIKLNQIGTLTETIDAIKETKKLGWKVFISHRSGETSDSFIADLAVGVSAEFIKAGAPIRAERVAKYNRLMEIEDEILGVS